MELNFLIFFKIIHCFVKNIVKMILTFRPIYLINKINEIFGEFTKSKLMLYNPSFNLQLINPEYIKRWVSMSFPDCLEIFMMTGTL